MSDDYVGHVGALDAPASNGLEITPSDIALLPNITRALYVGTSGHVKVTMLGGQDISLKNVSGILPIRVTKVWATGTTATDIVGVW